LTTTLLEKSHPEYTAYVEDAYNNSYAVNDGDHSMYDTAVSLPIKGMQMSATLLEKDELSRRKAQGFQTYVKGQRKVERV
jgi:hypothetical protein